MSIASDNKRIAKNTLLLYIRMFFTMLVGLYTSRVILSTLGFSDYGIYNVVGGIVVMFAFLKNAMVSSSQRFISYEIGRGRDNDLNSVFGTSNVVHIVLSISIGITAVIFGYYMLNYKLNIPAERLIAANWVLYTSIISFIINITNVPFTSSLVAHEHMGFFAFQSIIDAILRLGTVYLLVILQYDKLILFSIMQLAVEFSMACLLRVYCLRLFSECKYLFLFNKNKFKEMFEFAIWSFVGNFGFSVKGQGANMIINIFCGTTVNAARGVALQVSGIISNFSGSFMTAINPQITKSYASGDLERSRELVYMGTRYTFFLLSLIVVPFILNVDFVLKLWLGEVPPYTSVFIIFTLVSSLLYSMSQAVTFAIQATGNIKTFQILVCIIMLMEIPLVYVMLKLGCAPNHVMIPTVLVNLIALLVRIYLLKRQVPIYSIRYYLTSICSKNAGIIALALSLGFLIKDYFTDNIFSVTIYCLISEFIIAAFIFVFGLNITEKRKVLSICMDKLLNK